MARFAKPAQVPTVSRSPYAKSPEPAPYPKRPSMEDVNHERNQKSRSSALTKVLSKLRDHAPNMGDMFTSNAGRGRLTGPSLEVEKKALADFKQSFAAPKFGPKKNFLGDTLGVYEDISRGQGDWGDYASAATDWIPFAPVKAGKFTIKQLMRLARKLAP